MPLPDGHGYPGALPSFRRILADAINDLSEHGYTSPEQINEWVILIRQAAARELGPEYRVDDEIRRAFGSTFARYVDNARVVDRVPGVTRFNISLVKPQLRAELDRRILASADLIKLRRKQAIEESLARFAGWSTSIPAGGTGVIDKRAVRADIGKSVQKLRWEERRVRIDQTHKLIANISHIVAVDAGAIAAEWHSHGADDPSYDARPDHMERNGKIYAIRDCWAVDQGLINKGDGYTDEMTAPGQEVFCRCFMKYITSPRRVPNAMLTAKGKMWLNQSQRTAA